MIKEKFFLIILLAIICLFSAVTVSAKIADTSDIEHYRKAILLYQKEEYGQAYYQFSQVSRFSDLKSAALFRQARCATSIGDTQAAIKSYIQFLKRYPNSPFYAVAEYNLATLLFECGDKKKYNEAKKHFMHILKEFQETEVAIASKYYLGLINKDSKLLLEYIKLSPKGRYSQNAIKKLIEFDTNLSNQDNLIIANSLLEREQFEDALEYYKKTNLLYSWCGYATTQYRLGHYDSAKALTVKGLKDYSNFVDSKKIYEVIDYFISLSNSKLTTIKYLLSINQQSKATDYLLYLMAKQSTYIDAINIYETLYSKFPDGQFSGEALYKIFYAKLEKERYEEALKLGKIHLAKFSNTNSAPAVMYWMGKVCEKRHMNDMAKSYYKGVISKYPDSYYAMRANAKLNPNISMLDKNYLAEQKIVCPIKNKPDADFANKLIRLGDYDFAKELYGNDKFVESWIEYQKGNYTNSALIARNAIEEMSVKPSYKDPRWRLVYPIHYYNFVQKYKGGENPIILLSIIKEESHFNPMATSCVGAGGLMQLMPATANEIANGYRLSNNLYNPENNIHLGCLYYAKIKKYLNGKDMSAIMAYNGGIGAVKNWKNTLSYSDIDEFVEKIPYPETQEYLKKVLKAYWNYSQIY